MGKNCQVISSATAAVTAIEEYFRNHPDVEKQLSRNGEQIFYTTDSVERFEKLGTKFLGRKVSAERVDI